MDWFYVQNGKQVGPVPVAQLDELVRSGRIPPETLVWREGLVNWQPFGAVHVQGSSLPSPPPEELPPGAPPRVLSGARTNCAECGVAFPESEMIPFAGSWICAKCKPIFFQRVREGAPLAGAGAVAWQSGVAVVVPHGGTLPTRCVRCNGAVTGKFIARTYYWHLRWLYLLLLIPPICVIVWFMLRKRVDLSVPICEECQQRRRRLLGVSWLIAVIGIACLTTVVSMAAAELSILAFETAIPVTLIALLQGRLLYLKQIDSQHIWLCGFCKEYRASLPEFPGPR